MTTTQPTSPADAVRGLILAGEFAPGDRLGEAELAGRIGVSRTPVREALRSLAAEGLVEITPNKGARVVRWSDVDLEQVFELRAQVEGLAARLAARRADLETLAELEAVATEHLAECESDATDLDRVYTLNAAFHAAVIAISGGTTLPSVVGSLVHTVVLYRTLNTFDRAALLRSAHHHLELVAAMRTRDGRWAESVMRSHLYSARASLLGPRTEDR